MKEMCILNRTLRAGIDDSGEYIDWEPYRRHVEVLLKEEGVTAGSKPVSTPSAEVW